MEATEPGFYWMRHTVAVIENDSFTDERWVDRPVVARFDGRDWFPFEANALADQFEVEVLSERLAEPVVVRKTKERLQAERIVAVVERSVEAEDTQGGAGLLSFDREQLLTRIEEILKR